MPAKKYRNGAGHHGLFYFHKWIGFPERAEDRFGFSRSPGRDDFKGRIFFRRLDQSLLFRRKRRLRGIDGCGRKLGE